MKKNLPVTDREVTFDKELISRTDLKGAIKGFNEAFQKVSGFDSEELMNSNHNIIRHPDMPPAAFEDMWASLKSGKHWMGMVKNRTKSGDFYWVDAYVTPIFEDNSIVGYESVRAKPSQQLIKRAEQIYQKINAGKKASLGSLLKLSIKSKSFLSVGLVILVTLITQYVFDNFVPAYLTPLISIIFGGTTYLLLKNFIFKTLNDAVAKAKAEIDNPLMAMMYSGNNDEISNLTLVSEMLKARLRTVLTIMEDSSHQIETEATQTYKSQNLIAASMKSQAEQIDQVATAMTEMSASIQEVASNASGAATKASEVDDLSQQASTLSGVARQGLVDMDKVFDEIIEIINELNSNTKAITPMIGVIANVAEQTNLLALNAAIEAARAGEHGRGFAVVAEEVRNLASRTQASTVEISELIKKLDNAMEKTISGTNRLKITADNSSNNVEKSIDSASAIAGKIQQLNELVIMIATAVEEQSAVSEDINKNVVRISTDAESVAQSSSATSINAQNLAEESNNLTSMVRRFRSQ